jgi:hypothetical protein
MAKKNGSPLVAFSAEKLVGAMMTKDVNEVSKRSENSNDTFAVP